MKNTCIKLFIGLVLFGTLVALTVLNVANAERLTDLIYAALVGLGIYHLGGSDSGSPPADKQSGRASIGMLASLAVGAFLLAACASIPTPSPATKTSTTQSAQVAYTQACAAWGAGFAVALEMRRAGKLNQAQIDQVTVLDSQATPICTGPLPADPAAATAQITAAVTALAIIEAVKHEVK